MSKKKIYNKKQNEKDSFSMISIIPILLIVFCIPIVVRARMVKTNLAEYTWYSKASTTMDVFLKTKSILFLFFCSLMIIGIIWFAYRAYKPNKRNKAGDIRLCALFASERCLVPLGVYMVLIVISTIVSKHSRIAIVGMVDQYESMWVLLGYGLVVFYTYIFLATEKQLHTIINTVILMTSVVSLIGLSQMIGHDFFQTGFGKALILKYEMSFRFDKGHVYATLYNPNYVGLFAALLIPVLLVVTYSLVGYRKKILCVWLTIALAVCAYGSKSSSGIVGMVAGLFALGLILAIIKPMFIAKHVVKILAGIVVLVVLAFAADRCIGNPIKNYVTDMYKTLIDSSAEPESELSSIITRDDEVELIYKEEPLKIQFFSENGQYAFGFYDSVGNELSQQLSEDNKVITITEEKFQDFQFFITQYEDVICFAVKVEDYTWYFTNQTDGTYYYCNNYMRYLKINQKQEFKAFWKIGSGRGYIWDKTIPIIKEHPLFGTGPDTYAIYFPNTDYLNLYHMGFTNEIVTKPHSLYLQIASQTGLPSVVAFIAFYVMYAISSIRLYRKYTLNQYEVQMGIAILAGTFGYLVAAMANDSTIAVAPLFWTLMGVGVAINQMIKKMPSEKQILL